MPPSPRPVPISISNCLGTDAVAWVTLLVALATLIAVLYQIQLARQELRAVKEDLENNRQQIHELFRRPDLREIFSVFNKIYEKNNPTEKIAGLEYLPYYTVNMQTQIKNHGGRAVDGFMLEVLTPLESTIYRKDSETRTIITQQYVANLHYNKDFVSYPFGNTLGYMTSHRFRINAGKVTILWRLYDEHGSYPADGYGRWTFTV